MPEKTEIFSIWPFTENICQALLLSYSLKLQHREVSSRYQCLYKVSNALTENQHRLLVSCTP